jgi:hypothetical protein
MKSIFVNRDQEIRSGWKVLGFLLLTAILSILFNLALRPALPFLKAHASLIPGPLASGLLLLIPTALCLRLERAPLRSVGLDLGRRWFGEAALGTALGIGLILLTALVIFAFGGLHFERNPAGSWSTLLAGAWLYLGVALSEELTFRGYAFQRLVRGMGEWPAQLLLAGLFALAHWSNPGMTGVTRAWASLNIGMAAIFLGLALLKTRSLALPIGIHLGWNWAQGLLLGFGVSGTTSGAGLLTPVFHGRPQWLTGGAFGPEASLPCLLILGAACLCLTRWKRDTQPSMDRAQAPALD